MRDQTAFPPYSRILKVVSVDPLYLVDRGHRHPDTMVKHQPRKHAAIDEDDFRVNPGSEILGFAREARCRNKYALLGSLPLQGTGKPLNVGSADGPFVPLCLKVDNIEAKGVFFDDAVDAFIA